MSHPIDTYRQQTADTVARLRAQLSEERSPGRRTFLSTSILAQQYGCNPSARWEALLGADGSPRGGAVDAMPRPHRIHTLRPRSPLPEMAVLELAKPTNRECADRWRLSEADWKAETDRTACLRLAREIEGCRRALWLYLLWAGEDVSSLRSTYYHPDEFMGRERWVGLGRPAPNHTDYWRWAYRLLDDGDCLDNLLQYLRGLLWARAERGGKIPAGEAFLVAVEALIDRMCGVEVAA